MVGLVLCVQSHQQKKQHTVNTGKTTQARNGWASFMCTISSAEKAAVNTGKTTQARNGWTSFMYTITSREKTPHSQYR